MVWSGETVAVSHHRRFRLDRVARINAHPGGRVAVAQDHFRCFDQEILAVDRELDCRTIEAPGRLRPWEFGGADGDQAEVGDVEKQVALMSPDHRKAI